MSNATDSEPQALVRFDSTDRLEDMLAVYRRDGGFIIEGMVPLETVSAISDAAILRARAVVPGSATQGIGDDGKEFVGANTVRFSSLGTITPAFFDLLENPIFESIADAALAGGPDSYWVNTSQVMLIGPGEPAQLLHRDADNWWDYVSATWPNTPEITISTMIGLDQVTEELGATRVCPGSHLWPEHFEYATDYATVPAELGPGDALIYSGYTVHGGGANLTSDRWRRAMHLSFVAGWLTPEEACAIDYTTEALSDRSPRVQKLLGHRSYDPRPHRGAGLWLKDVKAIEEN